MLGRPAEKGIDLLSESHAKGLPGNRHCTGENGMKILISGA
jgi:hypothetical protein